MGPTDPLSLSTQTHMLKTNSSKCPLTSPKGGTYMSIHKIHKQIKIVNVILKPP